MGSYTPAAERWLTLARAFLAPTGPAAAQALLQWLPGDLDDLFRGTHPDAGQAVDRFVASLARLPDAQALQVHYSGLFLAPPVRARLNLGFYLDGTLNGVSQDAIGVLLAKHGIARNEGFRDLPDHLAMLLEVMALLAGDPEAGQDQAALAQGFLLPALPRLRADVAAHAPDSPYLHLIDLVLVALAPFGVPCPEAEPRQPRYDKSVERGVWRHCARCDQPYAREKELRIMARALEEQGLPSDHLQVCPACRNATEGWVKRPLPGLGGSR